MVGISSLWLPILLSSVIVFIASAIIQTLLPWHKGDYRALAAEDGVMEALRPFDIPPGDYMMPRPGSMGEMRSPAFVEKRTRGPAMLLTVMPNGMMGIGRNLVLWFIYLLVVGLFAAYIAGRALGVGANYLNVFRFVGATAFLAYTMALWQLSIWYNRSWGTTVRTTIDGLIYALLTAGTFGWLWPR